MVTSAEISPFRRTNDAVCIFSYEYLSEMAKSNCAVKRIGESARWADLTMRLIVKANSMSARIKNLGIASGPIFFFFFLSLRGGHGRRTILMDSHAYIMKLPFLPSVRPMRKCSVGKQNFTQVLQWAN